jgi:PAS domain S-box-containing protein
LDGILTSEIYAVLLHAEKGDLAEIKEHKARYDEIGILLDELLKKDAKLLVVQSRRSQEEKDKTFVWLKNLDEINLKLVDLETRAFEEIEKNDTETAYSLVGGEDYHKYKLELYQSYRAWTENEHELTQSIRNSINRESQQTIYFNLVCSLVGILFLVIVIFMLHSFIVEKEKGIIKKEKELNIRGKMEQKYRILFENATDAIFIADAETRQLVDCNESAENLMGYSRDELLSMNADELHPKDKIKETMEGFKKQIEGKIKSVFTEVLTKNNKRIPVKINASAVLIGNKRFNQGMFITTKPSS